MISLSSIKPSARKWIFLAGALGLVLICLGIDAVATDMFEAHSFERSPPLPMPADWPKTTIFSRVCDWVEAGGGPVPANLTRAMETYPVHIAVCLIVINRNKVPASEKARIAQISGLVSARAALEEVEKYIQIDASVVELKSSFDLLRHEDREKIENSVISAELHRIGYPTPKAQQIAPSFAQEDRNP